MKRTRETVGYKGTPMKVSMVRKSFEIALFQGSRDSDSVTERAIEKFLIGMDDFGDDEVMDLTDLAIVFADDVKEAYRELEDGIPEAAGKVHDRNVETMIHKRSKKKSRAK